MKPDRIILVYNADAGLFNAVTGWSHKFFSPETYQCTLCRHTFGLSGMLIPWKNFLQMLPFPAAFLHRDEFRLRQGRQQRADRGRRRRRRHGRGAQARRHGRTRIVPPPGNAETRRRHRRGDQVIVPRAARRGLGNFFHTLAYPTRFVGNVLSGQGGAALRETGCFLVNTTAGIGGFYAAADRLPELRVPARDLGVAFANWGVGHGTYVVLPVVGPTSLRDGIGDAIGGVFLARPNISRSGSIARLPGGSKPSISRPMPCAPMTR